MVNLNVRNVSVFLIKKSNENEKKHKLGLLLMYTLELQKGVR